MGSAGGGGVTRDLSPNAARELAALAQVRGPGQVEAILTMHQRMDNGGPCICGWNELGKSHSGHQAHMLREAGLLKEDTKRKFCDAKCVCSCHEQKTVSTALRSDINR